MKAIPFVFVIGVIVLLSCVGQEQQPGTTGLVYFSITDKQLDMANVTKVSVTIDEIRVHQKATEQVRCRLSLCDCKCYPEGQTPEELNQTICGINCLGEFNVSGCAIADNVCKELSLGQNETEENNSSEADSWVTILNESKTYDLMALSGIEELVSSVNLESGDYNIIRLEISDVKVIYNGVEQTAKLPSGKIDINIAFMVTANKSHLVSLDFDLNDSLHIANDGTIVMAPVIRVEVSRDVELNITNGKVKRITAEKEAEEEVGMDENGSVGEGKRINGTKDLVIDGNGTISERERERNQYDVNARVNGFTPDPVTISVGDTVRWIFRDSFSHRLVSDAAGFDSMARYQDQVWTYTFNTAGTFAYHDSLNPNAQGTVIVE